MGESGDWREKFDPGNATGGPGIFGLPCGRAESGIVLLPVPSEVTCSYRVGTARGPSAVLQASGQLDLEDRVFGPVWRAGICLEAEPPGLGEGCAAARRAYESGDSAAADAAGERVIGHVRGGVSGVLAEEKVPGVVGGEHSVALGAVLACAAASADRGEGPIGVLQIDAHMDLREAYEGCRYSHASVVRNVLEMAGPELVSSVVQVGIRDFSREEARFAERDGRVSVAFADDLHAGVLGGTSWRESLSRAIGPLPELVYVTMDVDGLEPGLCPSTGTPVPGGLGWPEFSLLLRLVAQSGRRVIGFDLVEVSPGPGWRAGDADGIDAMVGARALYRLCGLASATNGLADRVSG